MIGTQAELDRALEALLQADARLGAVAAAAVTVRLRQLPGGLPGLLRTVAGQQVSTASADAIFARFAGLVDLADPGAILSAGDATFRAAGLSRAKERTVLAVAAAVSEGRLDLARMPEVAGPEAVAALVAIPGIGRWTAECHLLFSAGHPDIFPAGDLALQVAVAHAFRLPERIAERPLAAAAELWMPSRSVAAHLFWAYYHALTRRSAVPAEAAAPGSVPAGPAGPASGGREPGAVVHRRGSAPPLASQSRHDSAR